MFDKLKTRIARELSHFYALKPVVRRLIYSYIFYLISYPMLGIFINVYFWRQSNDITLIVAYNLGYFLLLPISFYINGILLRKIHILKLYWFGVFTQGIAASLAIFFPNLSFDTVLLYGSIYGLGGGLYWANKNYITLKLTKGTNRIYYNSIETSIDLIAGILLPVVVGWSLVLGEKFAIYSIESAYKSFILIALLLLWFSGYLLQGANIYSEKIDHLLPKSPTRTWQKNRLIMILYQMVSGANFFIPTLLTLLLIGTEGELGTLESLTALLTVLLMYWIGRKIQSHHSLGLYIISTVVYLLASTFLLFSYSYFGALIYILVTSVVLTVIWNLLYTNSMEVMDKEQHQGAGNNQYALVLDNEISFNYGRLLGMIILFGIYAFFGLKLALTITPIILSTALLLITIPFKKNLAS